MPVVVLEESQKLVEGLIRNIDIRREVPRSDASGTDSRLGTGSHQVNALPRLRCSTGLANPSKKSGTGISIEAILTALFALGQTMGKVVWVSCDEAFF